MLISQLDMQQGWIDEELIRKRAQGLGFQARTVFYDDASDLESMLKLDRDADLRRVGLALVDAGEMRRLAEKNRLRPIGELAEVGDVESELREHLPLARDGARVASLGDDVYGLPRSVDTPLMVYRRSKVQEAMQVWEQKRPEIDALFKAHNGRGLPQGYALEPDPNRWDSYDLAVAAYVWASTDYDGNRAPRVAHRGFDGADTAIDLYLRVYGLGGGPEDVLDGQTDPLRDAFVWEAFMARGGLYPPRMWLERWGMGALWNAMGEGTIFLTFMHPTHAALLHGGVLGDSPPLVPWPDDLAAARLPRGVSLELGTDGLPARMGDGAAPARVTYWVIPRTGPDAAQSGRLAAALTAEDAQAEEAVVFATVPSRQDVTDALGSLSAPQWIKDLVIAGSQQAQFSRPLPTDPNATQVALEYVSAWRELAQGPNALGGGPLDSAAVRTWLQPISARVRALTQ